MAGKRIGEVSHFFDQISVAVITLTSNLAKGDKIHFLGHTTDFEQRVTSIEVQHHPVVWVKPGDSVALKVIAPVREHDVIYRVTEDVSELHIA